MTIKGVRKATARRFRTRGATVFTSKRMKKYAAWQADRIERGDIVQLPKFQIEPHDSIPGALHELWQLGPGDDLHHVGENRELVEAIAAVGAITPNRAQRRHPGRR